MTGADSPDARAPVRPLRIGLTGGIGSGKSTVARLFSVLGIAVIDADEITHRLMSPGGAAVSAILREFGDVLADDGGVDRGRLGGIVFEQPQQRRRLEALLHPMIRADMERAARHAQTPYCILVIPLLVETAQQGMVDRVLVVDADEGAQIERVRARDQRDDAAIRSILAAQASRGQRLAAADDVISNRGDLDDLRDQVDALHRRYLALAAAATGARG
ncbi:MAG: dephospho-CoA kinase [Chromatiales bacterium]|nr:dephospho-CoA kinase [Chromatiales bacterium]